MRIRLLREAGGVGDVLCALGCATAIKRARPDAYVGFYTLDCYKDLVALCPDVDLSVSVAYATRRDRDQLPDPRRHRYLRDGRWSATVDLFCPGWKHEWATQGDVVKGRPELFCETAAGTTGLDLQPTPPRIALTDYERGVGEGWLRGSGLRLERPIVALQPQANLRARQWPEARWAETVELLRQQIPGVQFICFGTRIEARDLAVGLKTVPAIFLPYPLAAAVLARCAVLVGVDSGFYHLAAALSVSAVGIFGVTGGASTSAVYPKSVYLEAGDMERVKAGCACVRHCYNMMSAGKQSRCNTDPCPAMAEILPELVANYTLSRLAV